MINDQSADNLALVHLPAALTVQSPVPNAQSPAAVYLASLSEGSRRTMRTALNTIGGLLGVGEVLNEQGQDVRCLAVPWASLRYQHTAAIRATLQERYAPATANKLLAALRRVLKEARRLGQMSADDHDQASDLKNVRGTRLPRGRALSEGEVASLMRSCADDATAAGARDAAIIALLRGTGLRRSEAVALDLADYESLTGAITIRSGKGKKDTVSLVNRQPHRPLFKPVLNDARRWARERRASFPPQERVLLNGCRCQGPSVAARRLRRP